MRDLMKIGDGVLFYHSSCAEPGIAGLAEVCQRAVSRSDSVPTKEPVLRRRLDARYAALGARRYPRPAQDAG
jgi:predicted RNA-binding protein with PUA-like domain